MPGIESIAVSTPEYQITPEDMKGVAEIWLEKSPQLKAKFIRISEHSGVKNRRLILPYGEILKLGGLSERSAVFEEVGFELLNKTVEKCLNQSSLNAKDIEYSIFSSCSVPAIPSVDAKLVDSRGLSQSVKRVPVFQHGCVGGVTGLSLGCELASQGKKVLVSSLELCSLVFQFNDSAASQLVGASIFADGSASVVLSPQNEKLKFLGATSFLLPNSRHLMGYDIFDDGFHLRLDKELPSLLVKEVPQIIQDFLKGFGLSKDKVQHFLFHPGGRKILDFFDEELALLDKETSWARKVLSDHGNMSSATIFFVLERFLREAEIEKGDKALVLGIGPGLTLELILFEA